MDELIKALDETWKFYEADRQACIEFFRSGYKYFDKEAKEKNADEMEADLNSKRASIENIRNILLRFK